MFTIAYPLISWRQAVASPWDRPWFMASVDPRVVKALDALERRIPFPQAIDHVNTDAARRKSDFRQWLRNATMLGYFSKRVTIAIDRELMEKAF
jgi:hypothetical protein